MTLRVISILWSETIETKSTPARKRLMRWVMVEKGQKKVDEVGYGLFMAGIGEND